MDIARAAKFLAGHARVLDRRRFELLTGTGTGSSDAVLAALDGYRNPDGGYGWGIEPDLRDPSSQPAGALHAFEVLAEAPEHGDRAVQLCDWLAKAVLSDGGLPFARPVSDSTGVAPFWAGADHAASSLHITAAVTTAALAVPGIEDHPWLARSIQYCRESIAGVTEKPFAIEYSYILQLLDALGDTVELERLAQWLPADGLLPVDGGAEGEALRPLDVAPWPDRPIRSHYSTEVIATELARLDAEQQSDGGWLVDFDSYSPAATLEWRGYATVRAVAVLLRNRM